MRIARDDCLHRIDMGTVQAMVHGAAKEAKRRPVVSYFLRHVYAIHDKDMCRHLAYKRAPITPAGFCGVLTVVNYHWSSERDQQFNTAYLYHDSAQIRL